MKSKFRPGLRRFRLKLLAYHTAYYIEAVAELEAALAGKPRELHIDMLGDGEVPADMALLICSILMERPASTRLITHARSSLQNGAVLVWLLGDTRIFREDARIFFRRAEVPEDADTDDEGDPNEEESKYSDSYSETDPEEADYAEVLRRIGEFLPVQELAGRPLGVSVLRQFGLVESEQFDQFLARTLGAPRSSDEKPSPEAKATLPTAQVKEPQPGQVRH
jgi:hypothetical protein